MAGGGGELATLDWGMEGHDAGREL